MTHRNTLQLSWVASIEVDDGVGQLEFGVLVVVQTGFEGVAERCQFVYFGYYSVLFGKGGEVELAFFVAQ